MRASGASTSSQDSSMRAEPDIFDDSEVVSDSGAKTLHVEAPRDGAPWPLGSFEATETEDIIEELNEVKDVFVGGGSWI
eukprot:6470492-Pyramimonas_sp.AAC.1